MGQKMPPPQSKELDDFSEDETMEDLDSEESDNSEGDDKTPESGTLPDKKTAKNDKVPEGNDTGNTGESTEGTDASGTDSKGDNEPRVPLHRFNQIKQERDQLRSRIAKAEEKSPTQMTDAEKQELEADKYLERKMDAIIARRESQQAAKDNEIAAELVDLMEIYGQFDVDKVLDIMDEFKRKGSSLSSDGALAIYFERQKSSKATTSNKKEDKPNVPQPHAGAGSEPKSKPDVTGKPLNQVIAEAKKDYGLN